MQSLFLSLLALAGSSSAWKGFNYGATENTGACRGYETFRDQFNLAKSLDNGSGFEAARLYTMIQCGTQNDPISAIQVRTSASNDTAVRPTNFTRPPSTPTPISSSVFGLPLAVAPSTRK